MLDLDVSASARSPTYSSTFGLLKALTVNVGGGWRSRRDSNPLPLRDKQR